VPVGGGAPTKIVSTNENYGFTLAGSTGSLLVLSWNNGTLVESSYVDTVPIGTLSSAVDQIWFSYIGPSFSQFLAPSAPGDPSKALVFITIEEFSLPFAPPVDLPWASVITPSGAVIQAPTAGSAFLGTIGLDNQSVLEAVDVPNGGGGNAGGTLEVFDVATTTATPITMPGGGTYTICGGPTFAPLSNSLNAEIDRGCGAVLDVAAKAVYPVTIPNSTMSAAWF
jgi:hypothetical protein